MNALMALFNNGRYHEAAILAQEMTERFPQFGFGWKALGAVFKLLGRNEDALLPMQKAAELLPNDADAHSNLGVVLQELGQLDAAIASLSQALKIYPEYADAHYNLGITLQALGQYDNAVSSYRRALKIKPDYAEAHFNLGIALKALGKLDCAAASYRHALEIRPDYAEAHCNLGIALHDLKQYDDAKASFYLALQLRPDYIEAINNLGVTLMTKGQFDDAEIRFRQALQIKPDYADAYNNLGNTFKEFDKFDEAEESYRHAIQIKPDYADAYSNLGFVLKELGRLDEAEACCRHALQITPNSYEAYNNLGLIFNKLERLDEAEANYRIALQIQPDFVHAYHNLGHTLQLIGKVDEAVAMYSRALEIDPDLAEVHYNLGIAMQSQGQFDEAVSSYQRSIRIKPDHAKAYCNLGMALQSISRLDEAESAYLHALQIKPDQVEANSNMLFLYAYHTRIDHDEYLVKARGWELSCIPAQDRQLAHDKVFQRASLEGRRLRVGYVSGDFRQHAVSYFVEQLFAHHNRARIELFAYSTHGQRDAITERLQALADHWTHIMGMADTAVLDRIESDGIDVLIDLSGHTAHNRLGIFARRAAPVQAHYLGYFASTGLTEMDYWIGDEILTPAETDGHFSEQVWRLPRVWVCYDGKADAPIPNWKPNQDGIIWLGSFNNLGKLTPATLALWAKVLHALPEGKLLLKTRELKTMGNRQRILDALSAQDISPDRIELQDGTTTPDWPAHMACYDRLDIALDPVGGVGGGTTTCDALWMGAPVITLEGDRMASRMTASMLNAIGHPEWIASSEDGYIEIIVTLARDVEQRKTLRSSQREKMASSPLCDAPDLAKSLENAYLEMFKQWQAR